MGQGGGEAQEVAGHLFQIPRVTVYSRFGTAMIKPSMEHLKTIPNPYIEGKTYFPTAHTWDNLTEVLSGVIDDPSAQNEVVHNFRKVFLEEYTLEKFVLYWYNMIKEQPEVV